MVLSASSSCQERRQTTIVGHFILRLELRGIALAVPVSESGVQLSRSGRRSAAPKDLGARDPGLADSPLGLGLNAAPQLLRFETNSLYR